MNGLIGRENMKTILGISAFYHDAAAALISDGDIIAAAQEERFTRIKHDQKYPANTVAWCHQLGRLRIRQPDCTSFRRATPKYNNHPASSRLSCI